VACSSTKSTSEGDLLALVNAPTIHSLWARHEGACRFDRFPLELIELPRIYGARSMRVIVTWGGSVTCHGVDVIVIGNGLVHWLQHNHDSTLAFDETAKRKR